MGTAMNPVSWFFLSLLLGSGLWMAWENYKRGDTVEYQLTWRVREFPNAAASSRFACFYRFKTSPAIPESDDLHKERVVYGSSKEEVLEKTNESANHLLDAASKVIDTGTMVFSR